MTVGATGIHPDCYGCLINQARSTARQAGLNRTQAQDVLDAALRWILIARYNPLQVQHIVRHIADETLKILGNKDADIYAAIKKQSHEIALSFVDSFHKQMQASHSPLETGLRIAAAGNIIDFGAKDHASLDLHKELSAIDQLQFGRYDIHEFLVRISKARNLLYICDNAGEIVFDRLLMKQIKTEYPNVQITAAVRHSAIINDATLEDAQLAELHPFANVISSGSVYPGTILNECSGMFQNLYSHADLIISKGQGNFETLLNYGDKRVFFLLRIKCETMAHIAQQKKGDLVFMQGTCK